MECARAVVLCIHTQSQTTIFCVAMFTVNKQPTHMHVDALSTALPDKPKYELFLCKSVEKNHFHFSHKEVAHSFVQKEKKEERLS